MGERVKKERWWRGKERGRGRKEVREGEKRGKGEEERGEGRGGRERRVGE